MSVCVLPAAAMAQAPAPSGTRGAQYPPPPPPMVDMSTPGAVAKLLPDGTAAAPAAAPPQVQSAIWTANHIQDKPYRYGGGHKDFDDSAYDCSGAVSYMLHGGGLLDSPLDSGSFMKWGDKGEGAWITIYTNPGHAFMVVAGLRYDTSMRTPVAAAARKSSKGHRARTYTSTRWSTKMRPSDGYTVRHPAGF